MPLATQRPDNTPAHAITSFEFAELLGVSASYFNRMRKKNGFPRPELGPDNKLIYDRTIAARFILGYLSEREAETKAKAEQRAANLARAKALLILR